MEIELRIGKRTQRGKVLDIAFFLVPISVAILALIWPHETFDMNDRRIAARLQMNNLLGALGQHKLDTNKYPTTDQGLASLVRRPENMAGWSGPYLTKGVPSDPWGHAYIYRYPGEHGDEPDLISLGEDGQPGGEGKAADIFTWKSDK